MSDEGIGYAIGDTVEVRDASGIWHLATALSLPRYDVQNAVHRRHPTLTVSVDVGSWGHPANWPAEDVQPVPPPPLDQYPPDRRTAWSASPEDIALLSKTTVEVGEHEETKPK